MQDSATRSLGFSRVALVLLAIATSQSLARPKQVHANEFRPSPLPSTAVISSTGETRNLAELRGAKGTVVVFLGTECPISNAYIPILREIETRHQEHGIRFVYMNPNGRETARQIAKHAEEYRIGSPVFMDADAGVAKELGITHCPSVCVFDGQSNLVYRGRIDDRYYKRGKAPKAVMREDLRDALDAVLAAKPIAEPNTEPVGCPIAFSEKRPRRLDGATVTFTRDIAPILQQHCQECHRPDGAGPFSLMNHDQAKSWGEDMRALTAERVMPPWKAEPGHGKFKNERVMDANQIELIAQWVREGMPEGDPADMPPPREFPNGWLHGTPDVVLVQDEDYVIQPSGPADDYRNFVFRNDSGKDWLVNTYEILPGNRRVVHHVLLFIDHSGISERLDARAKGPGYSANGAGGFPGFVPRGVMGGWAPGNGPHVLPEGMVNVIPHGARIVMQVHYHKTGKEERDRTRLALYLAKGEVNRASSALPLEPLDSRAGGLRIPPNASNHEIRASFTMPDSLIAVSVTPHMHLLGKDMKVDVRLPDGTVIPLVYVKTWDFNWQETYYFKEPIVLPAGSRIDMVAHYDNSSANPANPNQPPKMVTWGEGTNDEMCMAFVEVAYLEPTPYGQPLREPNMFELLRKEIRRTFGDLIRRR